MIYKIAFLLSKSGHEKKKFFFFCDPFFEKSLVENNFYIYVCDFPQKIFQRVTAPIPLFQTPQKIGLLNKQKNNLC